MLLPGRSLLVIGVLVMTGCATDPDRVPPSRQLWTAQGDPVTCINLRDIRQSRAVDDQTIDFIMNGRDRRFRNTLPMRCSGLGFNRGFNHNSSSGQLCRMNAITVIEPGRGTGAVCGLGHFQPMVPVPAPAKP